MDPRVEQFPPYRKDEAHEHDGDHDHGHAHHDPGFWAKFIFSTDHKVIGIQYGVTALSFLFFGLMLMLLMRWQIAHPGMPVPFFGHLLELIFQHPGMPNPAAGGVISPDLYNSFGAMHGTIMVFLGIVPLAFAAFGNYVVPLMIGAPDMAFPRVNMASYQAYFLGGLVMMVSFFIPGGAAQAGWTSYSPLATSIPTHGQLFWIIGMILLITSSLLGAVNFIATIIQLRAPGMTWMRMPFFVWAQFVTAFLLLLAFPPLEAAAVMQLMDNVAHTSFFLPTGLAIGGKIAHVAGGGSPLLWQHLFWFLGHPEVYVLILPAMGIVCEILACNTRKPIWGYKSLVYSVLAIGFLSMIVWAHHMYMTGMGTVISTFFQATTMIISIPSVIILTCLFISLWGGSIRINTPMLFALAFLPMFGIGGLTGLPLGFNVSDVHLHDTYYVIAHFHYVVAPGTIFGLFAGVYYWFPKMTGRKMNEFWGSVHFWCSLLFMNLVFMPMFSQGMAGMLRRMANGGANYSAAVNSQAGADVIGGLSNTIMELHTPILWAAVCLGIAQIPFIINFFWSIGHGERVGDNPWNSTTLEWQTPTPPPHGNFDHAPVIYRGPYEYSVPGHASDFTPQNEPEISTPGRTQNSNHCALKSQMEIPYTVEARPDTGLYNAKVGIWLFLASEVMLFGGLFSSYVLLRVGAEPGTWPHGWQNLTLGTINTVVLALSAITTLMAWVACKIRDFGKFKFFHACTLLLALTFLCIKLVEYHEHLNHYEVYMKDGTFADGDMVQNDASQDYIVIDGRYTKNEMDLYDLRSQKNVTESELKIPRSKIQDMQSYGPWHNDYLALYFTLTGLHALHILGGSIVIGYLWGPGRKLWKTDPERFTNRVEVSGLFWHFVDLVWIFLFPVLYLT